MRDYGQVSPMFWIGETGRALRKNPDAQRVALYFMTAPSSEMTGVFYCPLLSILNDVGYFYLLGSPSEGSLEGVVSPIEGVKQAIFELQRLGFCFYDFESEFVFVSEMARWQIAEELKPTDNRVVNVRKLVKAMPKNMAALFLKRYNDVYHLGFDPESWIDPYINKEIVEAPLKPLQRGLIKPLRSQEQEQEQEQDISITSKDVIVETDVSNPQTSESEKVEKPKTGIDCPYQKIVSDYNTILGPYLGMCQKLTPTRQKAVQARWRDCMKDGDFKTQEDGIAYFRRYFEYIKTCDFLMGNNGRDWRADFDWIFKQQNYTKICEGKYLSR